MPTCPHCGKGFVRRSHRLGPAETVLSWFLVYPYRCQLCTHRFLAFRQRPPETRHREYERMSVRFPVVYEASEAGHQIKGDGTVVGISIQGCALIAAQPMSTGTVLRLHLHHADGEGPIEVHMAVVRSSSNARTGLEFLSVREPEQRRLARLIETLLRRRTF